MLTGVRPRHTVCPGPMRSALHRRPCLSRLPRSGTAEGGLALIRLRAGGAIMPAWGGGRRHTSPPAPRRHHPGSVLRHPSSMHGLGLILQPLHLSQRIRPGPLLRRMNPRPKPRHIRQARPGSLGRPRGVWRRCLTCHHPTPLLNPYRRFIRAAGPPIVMDIHLSRSTTPTRTGTCLLTPRTSCTRRFPPTTPT